MKILTPEISWHKLDPVYSCDIELSIEDSRTWSRLATCGGGDPIIRIWKIKLRTCYHENNSSNPSETLITAQARAMKECGLSLLSSLCYHKKPVNVVRWSPSSKLLASGSDDSYVAIWRRNLSYVYDSSMHVPEKDLGEGFERNVEDWRVVRVLKRHLEDVYDLCWGPDDTILISGSVDSAAVQWRFTTDLTSAKGLSNATNYNAVFLSDHKHFVQGVAWDPRNEIVCTLSSDRSMRVYRVGSRNCLCNVYKIGKLRVFQDDSWNSFFRRPHFSPDARFLLCPAGAFYTTESLEKTDGSSYASSGITVNSQAAHLFHRSQMHKPLVSYPTATRAVVAVRFCPTPFKCIEDHPRLFEDMDYRWVFGIALESGSIIVCDTQHLNPIAQISRIHFQTMNDLAWTHDGHTLVCCSSDGFCTFIYFADGELGEPYMEPVKPEPLATTQIVKKRRPSATCKTAEIAAAVPFAVPVVPQSAISLTKKRRVQLETLQEAENMQTEDLDSSSETSQNVEGVSAKGEAMENGTTNKENQSL